MADCELPGCVLTGYGTMPGVIGGYFGSPAGGFGGVGAQSGPVGIPQAYPRKPVTPAVPFAPPKPKPNSPPTRTEQPLPQGDLGSGPLEPDQPPPDTAGAGAGSGGVTEEVTVTAPEYPEPRPTIGERIFFPIPAPSWLGKLYRFITGPWSPIGDLGNLLLYSQEAGADQAVEAQRVIDQLIPALTPKLTDVTFDPAGLPYPTWLDSALSDPTGIMQEVTVSGTRPIATPAPALAPALAPVGGFEPRLGDYLAPALSTATATDVAPLVGLSLSPLGELDLTNAIRARGNPNFGLSRAPNAEPSPLTEPLPDLSQAQCQCTKTADKNKKGKKRKPRDVCYRGVYEDRKNGLVKLRRERIQCR